MGFGNRRINYHNLDVAVCTRDEQELKLKHYLVDRHNNAYVHRFATHLKDHFEEYGMM